jgi:hypothetical protein
VGVSEPLLVRPENELEQALLLGGPLDVLVALAAADVYVPTVSVGACLSLGTIDHDGEKHAAVFSSPARMAALFPDGVDYVCLQGRALATAAPGLGVVVNPGSEVGAVLEAHEVAALEDAPPPPEPWLLVGAPAKEPEALVEAIRGLAAGEPAIRAAYRGLLLRRGARASELVLGLELEHGADEARVIEAAAATARDAGVEELALLALGGDDVSRVLVEKTEPFYRA